MGFRFAVLGDSIAQGVVGGAVGDACWSFPAILARALGLKVGMDASADFRVPIIEGDGLPLNLVSALCEWGKATNDEFSCLNWLVPGFPRLREHLRRLELFYERQQGAKPLPFGGVFHNLGINGLTARESHSLHFDECGEIIQAQRETCIGRLFPVPSAARHRIARMVLNPAGTKERGKSTQLDNLRMLVHGDAALGIDPEPLDAVILWLGSNDCLHTVVQLELRDMPASGAVADENGREYNLTSRARFAYDFDEVAEEIDEILAGRRTRVYVGSVPDITIPPIAKGLGGPVLGNDRLFRYYGRFFLSDHVPRCLLKTLSHEQAALIQARIASYNEHIERVCDRYGFTLVETGKTLQTLAMRRNAPEHLRHEDVAQARTDPDLDHEFQRLARERLTEYCEELVHVDPDEHPLLALERTPSVLMLETDGHNQRTRGGLISVDGVHPSTIGYGIAAEGFLKRLQVDFPLLRHARVPWQQVIAQDAVLEQPPRIWDDLLRLLRGGRALSDWVFRAFPL